MFTMLNIGMVNFFNVVCHFLNELYTIISKLPWCLEPALLTEVDSTALHDLVCMLRHLETVTFGPVFKFL